MPTERPTLIESVTDKAIVLNIDGEKVPITRDVAALRTLLKERNVHIIQYAEKIYNIDHIDEANFGAVTRRIVFNSILVRRLVDDLLHHKGEVQHFLHNLPPEAKQNWEEVPEFLKNAQSVVGQNFVWVLALELRRLFAIGGDKRKRQEEKVDEYIDHCFSAAKRALQLTTFMLVVELWEQKKQGKEYRSDAAQLEPFFGTRPLTLREYSRLLADLVRVFADNNLSLPTGLTPALNADDPISRAVTGLERLQSHHTAYGLAHCHTAEEHLADLLIALPLLRLYRLVSIKRIEYEEMRNRAPRYIKDFTILEKKDEREWQRILRFDDKPAHSYATLMHNRQRAVNLFPFVLDYHAFTHEPVFQIWLYECREGWNGLRYYNIAQEKTEYIHFCDAKEGTRAVRTEEEKQALERDVRCDLTIRQLEDAMNTLLGTNHRFEKSADHTESLEI